MASLYFIQAGARGPIKIGYSADVPKRLAQLQTGSAQRLELLGAFEHEFAPSIEKQLHDRFSELRLEGEWFRFDESIVRLIEAIRQHGNLAEFCDPSRFTVRALEEIRSSPVRDQLGALNWWVVEWSESQQVTHVGSLLEHLSFTHQALIFDNRGSVPDYLIVGIVQTYEDALALAAKLEPWLHDVSFVRRSGFRRGW